MEDKIVITEWEYPKNEWGIHPNMIYSDRRLCEAITDYYERIHRKTNSF